MKENVGRTDQMMRAFFGPLLLAAGYAVAGGKEGKVPGLLTMIAGALVTETAVTKKCPLNALFGIDTRERALRAHPAEEAPWPQRFESAGSYETREAPTAGAAAEEIRGAVSERARGAIDYSSFVNAASSLSFIPDEETAEAAVKAVLGILASRMEEPEAMRLVAALPDPLSLENLRGHQATVSNISVDQYYGSLSSQFHITPEEAQVLAVTVLRLVKEALDTEGMREVERSLPQEWTQLIERV